MERIKYLVNLLIIALLFGAIAIGRDGKIVGNASDELFSESTEDVAIEIPVETKLQDGTTVINTTTIAKDIVGFGSTTPLEIYVKGGVVERVVCKEHSETPSFFGEVVKSGLLDSWNGMTLKEAAVAKVDVVSGATYTSQAIIRNMEIGSAYAANVETSSVGIFSGLDIKSIIGILVILLGVVLTFVKSRNTIVEIAQMVLNVAVLGFWCGSFLSLSQIVSWMANGLNLSVALVTVVLLVVVVVMPMFGRKGSYCHMHCPMGSAQELLNRLPIPTIKISPKVNKVLLQVRYNILLALLFCMWLGVGMDLINYEIFSAFLLSSASTVVLIMAGVFLVLSLFIKRPYCMYVCPTGALITLAQRTKG